MWKTKLGKCIYTSPSGYKVHQNFFFRWLTLGSTALQTVMNRYNPHKPVLTYLPALSLMARTFPGKTCLLGLGGAGIPFLLEKIQVIAVEKSDEVIEIANKFFMIDSLKNLTIIHKNAFDYVSECNLSFSHLIIDLYNANHYPPECSNDIFFNSCKRIITDDGFLALNLANVKEQWSIFSLIKNHFKNTLVIPIKKSANMVIIASKNDRKDFLLEKINATSAFKKIFWVNSWGYVGDFKI